MVWYRLHAQSNVRLVSACHLCFGGKWVEPYLDSTNSARHRYVSLYKTICPDVSVQAAFDKSSNAEAVGLHSCLTADPTRIALTTLIVLVGLIERHIKGSHRSISHHTIAARNLIPTNLNRLPIETLRTPNNHNEDFHHCHSSRGNRYCCCCSRC